MPDKKKKHTKKSGVQNKNTNRNSYLLLGLIICLVVVAYHNLGSFNFVSVDDPVNVIGNKFIASFSFENIKAVFSKTYVQMYVPLTMISYMVDYWVAGKADPSVFHFFNLLYHLINLIVVFIFVKKLSGNNYTAIIVAALFGLHPMNVEVVAWVSTRSSLLFTCFGILSMIFYLKYLETDFKLYYLFVSCLFFLLSLLSKPSLILLPALLFCIDYYKKRPLNVKILIDKIPFILLAICFVAITILARTKDISNSEGAYSYVDRMFFASYGIVFYFVKLFVPSGLSFIHPFPDAFANGLPSVYYLSLVFLPLLILIVFKSGKMKRDVLFGISFFIINLILVLQLIPYGYSVVSERYVYLPYIGLFLIIGQISSGITLNKTNLPQKVKFVIKPAVILFILFLAVLTHFRTEVWRDPLTLFEDAVAKQPDSYYALYSRGAARNLYRDYNGAMNDYNKAIDLNPGFAQAYTFRGALRDQLNDTAGAMKDFNKSLNLAPNLEDAYFYRGNNYLRNNNFKAAIEDYNHVLMMDASHSDAICNRGTAFHHLNKPRNACEDWAKAAALGNKTAVQHISQYCK